MMTLVINSLGGRHTSLLTDVCTESIFKTRNAPPFSGHEPCLKSKTNETETTCHHWLMFLKVIVTECNAYANSNKFTGFNPCSYRF